jgi:hypothetical protein
VGAGGQTGCGDPIWLAASANIYRQLPTLDYQPGALGNITGIEIGKEVPEPSTFLLLASGVAVFLTLRRRLNRKA